jgi:hypothetical protein
MTPAPLSPIVPRPVTPGGVRTDVPLAARRPPPLARLSPNGARPVEVVYAFSTVDRSGRVADRRPIRALGWPPGAGIDFGEHDGTVVATRSPGASTGVDARGFLILPLLVRRWCGLDTGDRLLLAADPLGEVLRGYPVAVLDRLLGSASNGGGEPT